MEGWIALHRKLLDWEWWNDHNTTRLFLYLLLKANHKPKKWRGIEVGRGQLITGLDSLQKETGISVRSIRTSLKRLESTGEVTRKTTSKYSLITISRYSDYQDKTSKTTSKTTSKVTSKRQASDKQVTTNNNVNNENNENNFKNITPPQKIAAKAAEVNKPTKGLKSVGELMGDIPPEPKRDTRQWWQVEAVSYKDRLKLPPKDIGTLFAYFKKNHHAAKAICEYLLEAPQPPANPMAAFLAEWKRRKLAA